MRQIRALLVWTAVWVCVGAVSFALTLEPQEVAAVWLGGGVAAGILIVRPPRQWWLILAPAVVLVVGHYVYLDLPAWLVVVRGVADIGSAVVYALIIRSHRRRHTGLGADLPWVAVGLVVAVAVRMSVVVVELTWAGPTAIAEEVRGVWLEYLLGSAVGLVAGTATVLGLARWRPSYRQFPLSAESVVGTASVIATLVLVFFTPLGTTIPGSLYFIVPLLIAAAVRAPVPVSSLLTGVTITAAGVSLAQGWGPFAEVDTTRVEEVLSPQVGMLVLSVSVFLLSAEVAGRRHAEAEAAQASTVMRTIFLESPVPATWVSVSDGQPTIIREANPAFLELVGLAGDEVRGVPLSELLVDASTGEAPDLVEGRDVRATGPAGRTRWLRPTMSRSLSVDVAGDWQNAESAGRAAVVVLEDVTANRASEELLRQQARRDSLTGLPNRMALIERLDELLNALTGEIPLGLALIDIDGLKTVNDSLGHSIGDEVIVEVSRRLVAVLGPNDMLMRVGGDEFVVLCPRSHGSDNVEAVARRMLQQVRAPLVIAEVTISVTATAGAVETDDATTTAADVLRGADIALARAKAAGRNRVARFEAGQDRPALERLGIGGRLRQALADEDLVYRFQPVVATASGYVGGAEVLIRLREPAGTLTPPGRFLAVAAEAGLMDAITEQVLERSCRAAAAWRAAGHEIRVAFNAPPHWLSTDSVEFMAACIARAGIPWSALTLEVTEEETLDVGPDVIEALRTLRANGMHVAIDDFGTGYAGLDSFRSIPADIVKIDGAFVTDMLRTPDDRELVHSMVDLIHRFGKQAVAEGVETEPQLAALTEMGCEFSQGFLLSRPVPFEDFPLGRILRGRPDSRRPVAAS